MTNTLPVLLSIPHGGIEIPREIVDRVCLTHVDVQNDSDAFSRDVYDLEDRVAVVVATYIGRAFVDLNRAPDDLPPANPDGVIKSHTCYGVPIYQEGAQPDAAMIRTLLDAYYYPYHNQIAEVAQHAGPNVELGIDCHTMTPVGPQVAPDPDAPRPMICLGNVHGRSCSQDTMTRLARCFVEAFELEDDDVTYNQPFAGGFITRHYGTNPIPWVQVEMNQAFYLEFPCFGKNVFEGVERTRLKDVREKFYHTLRLFFA